MHSGKAHVLGIEYKVRRKTSFESLQRQEHLTQHICGYHLQSSGLTPGQVRYTGHRLPHAWTIEDPKKLNPIQLSVIVFPQNPIAPIRFLTTRMHPHFCISCMHVSVLSQGELIKEKGGRLGSWEGA
jgi:hypothetical protein